MQVDHPSYDAVIIRKSGPLSWKMNGLTEGFTHEDIVIIIGGANDLLSQNRTPSSVKNVINSSRT